MWRIWYTDPLKIWMRSVLYLRGVSSALRTCRASKTLPSSRYSKYFCCSRRNFMRCTVQCSESKEKNGNVNPTWYVLHIIHSHQAINRWSTLTVKPSRPSSTIQNICHKNVDKAQSRDVVKKVSGGYAVKIPTRKGVWISEHVRNKDKGI